MIWIDYLNAEKVHIKTISTEKINVMSDPLQLTEAVSLSYDKKLCK